MERIIKLTESQMKTVINKIISEAFPGMYWLTKIKIDSPEQKTDETKRKEARMIGSVYNGPIAIEFNDGEWYNANGELINIDKYETEIHDFFRQQFNVNPEESRSKYGIGSKDNIKDPVYDKRYKGVEDFKKNHNLSEGKKTIKLTESQMKKMIDNIINEQMDSNMDITHEDINKLKLATRSIINKKEVLEYILSELGACKLTQYSDFLSLFNEILFEILPDLENLYGNDIGKSIYDEKINHILTHELIKSVKRYIFKNMDKYQFGLPKNVLSFLNEFNSIPNNDHNIK